MKLHTQAVLSAAHKLLACYRLNPLEVGPGQLAPGQECFEAFSALRKAVDDHDDERLRLDKETRPRQTLPLTPMLEEDLRKAMAQLRVDLASLTQRVDRQELAGNGVDYQTSIRAQHRAEDKHALFSARAEIDMLKQQLSELSIAYRDSKERVKYYLQDALPYIHEQLAKVSIKNLKHLKELRRYIAKRIADNDDLG